MFFGSPFTLTRTLLSRNLIRSCSVALQFNCEKIVPDVICNAPLQKACICYPSGEVELGNTFKPESAASIPTSMDWEGDENCYYVVLFVDPDQPCTHQPDERNFLHWLVVNIPGNKVKCGLTLCEYIGPVPFEGTSIHRMVYLVLGQKCLMQFDEKIIPDTSSEGRSCFDVIAFANKYGLSDPVAGNFFKTEFECSVLNTLKKIGRA